MKPSVVIALLAVCAACEPGTYSSRWDPDQDANPADPPHSPPGPDGAPGAPDAGAQQAACVDIGAPNGTGEHNAGQPCMPCHAAGGGGPTFTVGGTLFDAVAGTTPIPGATILVRDADGQELALRTAQNGNFWTNGPMTFPIQVTASGCPDVVPMLGAVDATGGNCNAGGCHGSQFRVHLP